MALRRIKRTSKRSKAGMAWTETDIARLVKLYPKTSNKDLAVEFGRPVLGVIGKARGLGLKKDYISSHLRQQSAAWSSEEEETLIELFPTTPNEEIAEKIGRGLGAIAKKAAKLGLRKMEFWSEANDEHLTRLYKTLSYNQLASQLGRSRLAVQIRVITLGLDSKVESWAESEIDFLRKNYRGMHFQAIAEELGRPCKAVAAKAGRLGFVKNHSWSESDILKLKQLYARFTARQAAEMMGRSYKSVQSRIKLLGLNKKSGAAIKLVTDDHQIRTDRHFVTSGRFDKAS
ncbi:MAG TPA: hypothetical protein ENH94_09460 [Phycisphaerales bacterium]|nr:hypothetical protein [Phycisphaerales bacterium]